jgi:hypothetical protein
MMTPPRQTSSSNARRHDVLGLLRLTDDPVCRQREASLGHYPIAQADVFNLGE